MSALKRRYGRTRLAKADLERIAMNVRASARENTQETEEIPRADRLENGPLFHKAFLRTVRDICDSYLGDPRACAEYGCERPLTKKEAAQVERLAST